MIKNANKQFDKEPINKDLFRNEEEFSFTEFNNYTKSDNRISSGAPSKNLKSHLTTEDKKIKLLELSNKLISNILGFLTVNEKIKTIIFNKRLQLLTKIKPRHIKLKKILFDLFNPDFSSEAICKFITENDNFTDLLNRFKLMTELDVIRSLSLFLIDLLESNKDNNVFYTRINNHINIEFTNKFLNLHELKNTKLKFSIDELYSPNFYSFLNKKQILIDEIIISEKSRNLNEVFNHQAYKFKINKIKFDYEDEDFNKIKGLDTITDYFFNSKNSINCLEVMKSKKPENSIVADLHQKYFVQKDKAKENENFKSNVRSINNNFLNGKNIEEDIKKQNEVIYPSNPKHNKFEMDYFTHVDDLDTSKMDKLPVLQKTNICKPSFLGESISIANIKNKNKVYNLQQLAADANHEELDKLIAQQIESSSHRKNQI